MIKFENIINVQYIQTPVKLALFMGYFYKVEKRQNKCKINKYICSFKKLNIIDVCMFIYIYMQYIINISTTLIRALFILLLAHICVYYVYFIIAL